MRPWGAGDSARRVQPNQLHALDLAISSQQIAMDGREGFLKLALGKIDQVVKAAKRGGRTGVQVDDAPAARSGMGTNRSSPCSCWTAWLPKANWALQML